MILSGFLFSKKRDNRICLTELNLLIDDNRFSITQSEIKQI